MDRKYSITRILESLKNCTCTNIQQNYYLFDYYDEVLQEIGRATNIDFSTKIRTLQQIKKIFQKPRKSDFTLQKYENMKTSQTYCLQYVKGYFYAVLLQNLSYYDIVIIDDGIIGCAIAYTMP